MTFPTGLQASTDNLDSATDNPSLARVDLYNAVTYLNQIIDSENTNNGVVVLDSFGKITGEMIPASVNPTNNIILEPSTQLVGIKNILRLYPLSVDQLTTLGEDLVFTLGDVAMLTDGDAGSACMAAFDGTDWKVIALGATISAT